MGVDYVVLGSVGTDGDSFVTLGTSPRLPPLVRRAGSVFAAGEKDALCVDDEAAQRFPDDAVVRALGLTSVCCVPASDGAASVLLLGCVDRPLPPDAVSRARTLALGIGLAAASLERSARATSELAENASRLSAIVSSMNEGVWAIDAHGMTTFANEKMAEHLQCPLPELLKRSMFDFTDPDDTSARAHLAERREGTATTHDFTFIRLDGSEFLAEISTAPLYDESGEFAGAIAVINDVATQRELEAKAKSAERYAQLGTLAGGVAHQLNNALVGVVGNASLTRSELTLGSPAHAYLDEVQSAAERAAVLTRHLLAYSGGGRFVVEQVDLAEAAERACSAELTESMARIQVQRGPGVALVDADPAQLRDLVVQLVRNAIEAMSRQEDRVQVETGLRQFDADELDALTFGDELAPGPFAYLEVRDTGSGMDEATLARVFDPFFTTRFAGRGMGLPAALGIVRSHRGGLSIESELERGTRVCILLPLTQRDRVSAPTTSSAKRGRVVLLVDDDPTVRLVGQRLLERSGFEVELAADGVLALEAVDKRGAEIGVVILDLVMPRMGGREVLAQLKATRPSLPVVLTSGYAEEDVVGGLGADSGHAAFMQKPWRLAALLDRVNELLGPIDE